MARASIKALRSDIELQSVLRYRPGCSRCENGEVHIERLGICNAANRAIAKLEINSERGSEQQGADREKPDNAINEVWIRTKTNASDEWNELGLTSPIHDISKPERASDDTDNKSRHGSRALPEA